MGLGEYFDDDEPLDGDDDDDFDAVERRTEEDLAATVVLPAHLTTEDIIPNQEPDSGGVSLHSVSAEPAAEVGRKPDPADPLTTVPPVSNGTVAGAANAPDSEVVRNAEESESVAGGLDENQGELDHRLADSDSIGGYRRTDEGAGA